SGRGTIRGFLPSVNPPRLQSESRIAPIPGRARRSKTMRTLTAAAAVLAASAAAPVAAQNYGYGGGDEVIRCESVDGRTRECPTNGGRAFLERQISRAPCIEGRSWGAGRGGIWVSQGCRADFRVTGFGGGYGGGNGNGYGNIIRCD